MSDPVWYVAGLGNPEPEYAETRHNVGFKVIDHLTQRLKTHSSDCHSWCIDPARQAIFIKPMLGMNRSGAGIANEASKCLQTIVVYDDMGFEPGIVRIKNGGGHGGHNGVKSIIETMGKDFIRIRVGIGKPQNKSGIDFVLDKFGRQERSLVNETIVVAAEAILHIMDHGLESAMRKYNSA